MGCRNACICGGRCSESCYEAEDSFKCKKVLYKWETDKHSYINGFKDGATFGYNKAKEEMQEQGLALQSDMDKTIEQNIALKKELNKANEWHKVADEGLPINKNDGATYLLYTIYGEGGSPVVAHFAYRDKQELMNVWTGAILTEDEIVAWKEIVLPKEIKEK